MTQDEIIFNNKKFDYISGWHSSSPYGSIGNILHWLEIVGTFDMMENALVGDGIIIYRGETLASFEFDEDLMIPILTIKPEKYKYVQETQDIFIKEIKTKKFVVLKYLLLPDRGFRYYTENKPMNKKNDNGKFFIQPIFWTDDEYEADNISKQYFGENIASLNELERYFDKIINKDKYFPYER